MLAWESLQVTGRQGMIMFGMGVTVGMGVTGGQGHLYLDYVGVEVTGGSQCTIMLAWAIMGVTGGQWGSRNHVGHEPVVV